MTSLIVPVGVESAKIVLERHHDDEETFRTFTSYSLTASRKATLPQYPDLLERHFRQSACKRYQADSRRRRSSTTEADGVQLITQETLSSGKSNCLNIPHARAASYHPSPLSDLFVQMSNAYSSDGLQPEPSPNIQSKRWKHSMITRPCRISLETTKRPSRSLPNPSLGNGLSPSSWQLSLSLQHR